MYCANYETPNFGTLTLASDGDALVGCWFENDRFFGYGMYEPVEWRNDLPIFTQTRNWLDRYFAGEAPSPRELPLAARGSGFQKRVWSILEEIPYGETVTYGEIAKRMAAESGGKMSAQAVGGAVGRNPLCIIVPCHRVMGAKGNLTGFGGGIDMKVALLEHERVSTGGFFRPKKGTALKGREGAASEYFAK